MEEVDRMADAVGKIEAIEQMQRASRTPLNAITKASREVLLEGPTPVADAATAVRDAAAAVYLLLLKLNDNTAEHRGPYDTAYQELSIQHLKFIEFARRALEVQ
ncbi:hypothetical protein [Streptomyces sp. BH105]|uniref:hypothetical protein n=1 Tax=Streptomyces sp. BH105 TaxID=3410408 RepID=UPI003CEB6BDB